MLLILSLLTLSVAGPIRARYGVSWWGAIWRAWIIWAASVGLGYAATMAVTAVAPREETLAGGAGLAAWILVGVWFVLRFPGAVPAGARHQQARHAAMRAELAAVETRRQQPSPAREAVGRLEAENREPIRALRHEVEEAWGGGLQTRFTTCPRCGAPGDANARFCSQCGYKLSQRPADLRPEQV